jgi:predicted metalloprotease
MRWKEGRESDNVEDRRGLPGGPVVITGGLGTLVVVVLALALGVDPMQLLNPPGGQPPGGQPPGVQQPGPANLPGPAGAEDELQHFVRVVLADTEDVWTDQFRQMNKTYRKPHLVLFTRQVNSACGFASAAVGPFYCPPDERVYLDLAFFHQLQNQFHAPGEFAEAYVIAHEVGHHVQRLLGISARMDAERRRLSKQEFNQLSVRMELQADFFAGVWAHHADRARHILEAGDVEAGLRAASAVGDDRLQLEARGYVVPDSFTHGTSAQRVKWFRRGLKSGKIADGDTFNSDDL